jgi:hypothetical protein
MLLVTCSGQSPQALKALADQYNKDLMGRTFGSNTGQAVTGIGLGAGAGAALGGAFGGGKGAMMGGGIGAMLSALVPIIFPDYQKAFVWLQNAIRRGTVERDLKAINTKIDEAKQAVPEGESKQDAEDAKKAAADKQKEIEAQRKAAADAAEAKAVQEARDEAEKSNTPPAGNTQAAQQTPGISTISPAPAPTATSNVTTPQGPASGIVPGPAKSLAQNNKTLTLG